MAPNACCSFVMRILAPKYACVITRAVTFAYFLFECVNFCWLRIRFMFYLLILLKFMLRKIYIFKDRCFFFVMWTQILLNWVENINRIWSQQKSTQSNKKYANVTALVITLCLPVFPKVFSAALLYHISLQCVESLQLIASPLLGLAFCERLPMTGGFMLPLIEAIETVMLPNK